MLRATEVPVLVLLAVVEAATEVVVESAAGAVAVAMAKLPLPESDDLDGRSRISNGGGDGGDMFVNGTNSRGCGGGMERCIKDNRSSLLSSI